MKKSKFSSSIRKPIKFNKHLKITNRTRTTTMGRKKYFIINTKIRMTKLLKYKKIGEATKREKKLRFIRHQKIRKSSPKVNRKSNELNRIIQIQINLTTPGSPKSNISPKIWRTSKNRNLITKSSKT